jgi:hypothetical protein
MYDLLPLEMKEHILSFFCDKDSDYHYLLMNVNREFYYIITRLRKKTLGEENMFRLYTPYDIITQSVALIKWAVLEQTIYLSVNLCSSAAKHGNIDVLKWLCNNNCDHNEKTCTNAARNGHLELLLWVLDKGCICSNWRVICACAASNGHVNILEKIRPEKQPWIADTIWDCASLNGHLNVLKWAFENGCPMENLTCCHAAIGGHIDIIDWAHNNGCPINSLVESFAQPGGHPKVINWARMKGYIV